MNDTGYSRTDEELAFQKNYEAREAARHQSSARIQYRIIEGRPPAAHAVQSKVGWCVGRQIGEEKESVSQWFSRRVEADDYVRAQMRRDEDAAERLGVNAHVTSGR